MTSDDTAPIPSAKSAHTLLTPEPFTCECGYPTDSFACRIRHVHIDTSWARADH